MKQDSARDATFPGATRPPRRFGFGTRLAVFLLVSLRLAWGVPAWAADSTLAATKANRFIFWTEVTRLQGVERAVDVAFAHPGLNVVQPVDVAWVVDGAAPDVAAIATKPIQDTAEAGEPLGRFGAGILRAPIAIGATESSRYLLEASGRLVVRRPTNAPPPALATRFDSLALALGRDTPVDLAVSPLGILYVLAGNTVRVFVDPPAETPSIRFRSRPRYGRRSRSR